VTDTLKRLAGPVIPGSGVGAETILYDPAAGHVAAVKNAVVTNTDDYLDGELTISIGAGATLANRIVHKLWVPPKKSLVIPLDVVLDGAVGGDDIRAFQQSAAVAPTNKAATGATTATSTPTTASWSSTAGDVYILTVMMTNASQQIDAPASFVDTHTGISWKLVNAVISSVINATDSSWVSIFQYVATATGTTNTTTQATFLTAGTGYFIAVDEFSSGVDETRVVPLGSFEFMAPAAGLIVPTAPAGLRHAALFTPVTSAFAAVPPTVELADANYSTPAAGMTTVYSMTPNVPIASAQTGSGVGRLASVLDMGAFGAGLTVCLNGVDVT
jgi:hypothetical protein